MFQKKEWEIGQPLIFGYRSIASESCNSYFAQFFFGTGRYYLENHQDAVYDF
jgi:hypothetical protein